ncbi:MAG: DUF1488 family protein [Hyphomicrobiaceae bacterium]
MPLIRASGRSYPQRDAVYFPMFDMDQMKGVKCSVTFAALSGLGNLTAPWEFVETFERHRTYFEGCASSKYDLTGEQPPRLLPEDVFARRER